MSSYTVKFVTGDYPARQREANKLKAVLYLEGHANSVESEEPDYAMCVVAHRHSKKSFAIANRLAREMSAAFDVDGNPDEGPLVRIGGRGDFNLRYTDMPAVLLEPGFASNPKQAIVLESDEGLDELAEILYASIVDEFPHGGLIALSVGHKGKTSAPADRGAAWKGQRFKTEAEYVEAYLKKLENKLAGENVPEFLKVPDYGRLEKSIPESEVEPGAATLGVSAENALKEIRATLKSDTQSLKSYRVKMGHTAGLFPMPSLTIPASKEIAPGTIVKQVPSAATAVSDKDWVPVRIVTQDGAYEYGWMRNSSLIKLP